MRKVLFKLLIISGLILISGCVLAFRLENINNDLFVEINGVRKQVTFDGKEKKCAIISPDNKRVAFVIFQNGEDSGEVRVVNIDKPLEIIKYKTVEFRVNQIIWKNNSSLFLISDFSGGYYVFVGCYIDKRFVIEYEVAGRDFAFSPDKKKVIYCLPMPRFMPEKYATDFVTAMDLDKEQSLLFRLVGMKPNLKRISSVIYPFAGFPGSKVFENLHDRHFVVSNFVWRNNDEFAFVDATQELFKLVVIKFNSQKKDINNIRRFVKKDFVLKKMTSMQGISIVSEVNVIKISNYAGETESVELK